MWCLIGSEQTVRATRKVPEPPPYAKIVPCGSMQRRGPQRLRLRRLQPRSLRTPHMRVFLSGIALCAPCGGLTYQNTGGDIRAWL